MVAHVHTVSFNGLDVLEIEVQVQFSPGLPAFTIVGLPDKAVAESRERIRAALHSIHLSLPPQRLTINLAPADVQKEGSHFDLPMALGILVAMGALPQEEIAEFIVLGELALDGKLRPVSGILAAALHASQSQKGLICPEASGKEAAWAGEINILAPATLLSLLNHFKGTQVLSPPTPQMEDLNEKALPDLKEVKGQETAKRVLEIAAAGGHNMLMSGPPGSGKSMLATRLPSLLPPLDPLEALEVTMIYSVSGLLKDGKLIRKRPYRDPHHSASLPALVGGGMHSKPGEISLAHRGVLFLDEFPEFSVHALESLRQPLESGKMVVARANAHVTYPASVQLVAAMNPCRCGYLSDPGKACTRAPKCGLDYQAKLSGPILDRIDLFIDVLPLSASELNNTSSGEDSAAVAKRVLAARKRQGERYHHLTGELKAVTNAEIKTNLLEEVARLDTEGRSLLTAATEKMKLSARQYYRVLRVSRTIADLGESERVRRSHIAEALSYRRL